MKNCDNEMKMHETRKKISARARRENTTTTDNGAHKQRNKKEKRMQKTNAKSGRARLQIMKHPASLTSFQQWIYDAR